MFLTKAWASICLVRHSAKAKTMGEDQHRQINHIGPGNVIEVK
jgi:hypothetical protein